MKRGYSRRGNILVENIIFIIINILFVTILILFLYTKMSSVALAEEQYAKQIALIIDGARPGMKIFLNMEEAFDMARDEWDNTKLSEIITNHGNLVSINENVVNVKLGTKGTGYSYSFFNDVDVSTQINSEGYEFIIREKNE